MIYKHALLCICLMSIRPLNLSGTKLGDFIINLDMNITEIITNPTQDQGESLLYVLDELFASMRDVAHVLKFNPKFMYRTAKQLMDVGCPHFLDLEIDFENLHSAFAWERWKTDGVINYFNDIGNFTKTFQKLFPELRANEYDKYNYDSE